MKLINVRKNKSKKTCSMCNREKKTISIYLLKNELPHLTFCKKCLLSMLKEFFNFKVKGNNNEKPKTPDSSKYFRNQLIG